MSWVFLGDFEELFVNRELLDLYAFPSCGHVKFFLDGVGEAASAYGGRSPSGAEGLPDSEVCGHKLHA